MEAQQLSRAAHLHDQATTRVRILEDERNILEAKVHKLEAELNSAEIARDSLRKDKANVCILLQAFRNDESERIVYSENRPNEQKGKIVVKITAASFYYLNI